MVTKVVERMKQFWRDEKNRDFLVGFAGWFVVNGLVFFAINSMEPPRNCTFDCGLGPVFLATFVVYPVNIIALIVLLFKRRWVAWGMLTAFAVNAAILIVSGMFFAVICYGNAPFPFADGFSR